jgi:lipopolysaccharide/colanic/teichoic acid biosynthesis glycosyltransferase
MAEWFEEQGKRVARSPSSHWVEMGPRAYQAFPYHRVIHPGEQELTELLRRQRALALRYSTSADAPKGAPSYHVVFEGQDYALEALPKKARYDVRRGLERFVVEPLDFERLAVEGWELRVETLRRQGRLKGEDESWWRRACASAGRLRGFEAWGATDRQGGELASSLLAFRCGPCYSILYQQSRTEVLPLRPNHALTFAVVAEALRREGVDQVFYGLHSLDAPSSVDAYKLRLRFVARPVRQRVMFHPLLAPLVGPSGHRLLRALRRGLPDRPAIAKAEGMVRWFLEGQRPPETARQPSSGGAVHRSWLLKRPFDAVAAALGLVLLLPVLASVSLVLLLTSGRPVLFRQERVGRRGVPFRMYKFRTMATRPGAERGSFDPGRTDRVTSVGHVLRRTKLDELPQLWNVLTGSMSLVGPRPEVRKWVDVFPHRWARVLAVRPGMTDPASIEYRHEEEWLAGSPDPEGEYRDRILPRKLDLYEQYVKTVSFWNDIGILLRTLRLILLP